MEAAAGAKERQRQRKAGRRWRAASQKENIARATRKAHPEAESPQFSARKEDCQAQAEDAAKPEQGGGRGCRTIARGDCRGKTNGSNTEAGGKRPGRESGAEVRKAGDGAIL